MIGETTPDAGKDIKGKEVLYGGLLGYGCECDAHELEGDPLLMVLRPVRRSFSRRKDLLSMLTLASAAEIYPTLRRTLTRTLGSGTDVIDGFVMDRFEHSVGYWLRALAEPSDVRVWRSAIVLEAEALCGRLRAAGILHGELNVSHLMLRWRGAGAPPLVRVVDFGAAILCDRVQLIDDEHQRFRAALCAEFEACAGLQEEQSRAKETKSTSET